MSYNSQIGPTYALERFRERWYKLTTSVQLDPLWSRGNVDGRANFCIWMAQQYNLIPDAKRRTRWYLVCIDDKLPYGPNNCELVDGVTLRRRKKFHKVTTVLIKAVKEYIREHPEATATQVADMFKPYSRATLYGIIRDLQRGK